MDEHKYQSLTVEEIRSLVAEWEKEEKRGQILDLFKALKNKEQIEAVGKAVDTKTSLAILKDFLQWNPEEHWKISSLLVGLSHQVFVTVLTTASTVHIQVLQHEALRESLQHHLTLFAHEMEHEVNKRSDEIEALNHRLTHLDPLKLTVQEFAELKETIGKIQRSLNGMCILIDRALSVAWNSQRPDIIDSLSHAKETSIRMGKEHLGELPYKKIGDQVFGGEEAVLDSDPAVEALAKLNIWYLKDYFALGLLPSAFSEKEVELDKLKLSEKELSEKRA
ncbi:MAG: hypothetical protein KDK48_05940, partial [Chlamydiia bacterium]|nr:hypothetical protein [Chlamydiia bacterium]